MPRMRRSRQAAGVTLGEPISISEEGAPVPLYRGKMAAPMAAGAPVAQGEETLSVTVSVSWRSRRRSSSPSLRRSEAIHRAARKHGLLRRFALSQAMTA